MLPQTVMMMGLSNVQCEVTITSSYLADKYFTTDKDCSWPPESLT